MPSENIPGLWVSKRIFWHCHPTDTPGDIIDKANGLSRKITDSIQDPIARKVAKLGEKISGIPRNNEPFRKIWNPDSMTEDDALGYASWRQGVSNQECLDVMACQAKDASEEGICDPITLSTFLLESRITYLNPMVYGIQV